jgi:Baculovirus FP protein
MPPKANKAKKNADRVVDSDSNPSSSPIGTPSECELGKFNFDMVLQQVTDGLGKGEPQLDSIYSAIRLILTSIKEVTNALHNQSESYDNLLKENQNQTKIIEKLVAEISDCKAENKTLKKENEDLFSKINNLEQYSKNYNLQITGVPQTDEENTYSIVERIALQLDCKINPDEIEFCHRLRKNPRVPNKPPVIVVKFFSRQVKEAILAAKRKKKTLLAREIGYNGNQSQIFVNEHLTKVNNNLFWLARNTKNLGFKFAWTRGGQVYLRQHDSSPIIKINKPSDIPTSSV